MPESVAIKSERVKTIFRQKSSDITLSCLFMTKTLIWTWSSLWTCAVFNSPFLLHLHVLLHRHVLLLSLKLFYKQLKLQRLIPPQENRAEAKNRWFFGLPRLSRLSKLSGFSRFSKLAILGKIFNSEKHYLSWITIDCNYHIIISLKKAPVVQIELWHDEFPFRFK